MSLPTTKEMLDAGVHFGHLKRKWNPAMAPYIFMEKNGIHIIDLNKTVAKLDEAANAVKQIAKSGKKILFVATKKQGKEIVAREAKRVNMPFVTERWPGGMLTNFATIRKSVKKMATIDRMTSDGTFDTISKKEKLQISRKREKLEKDLGSIVDLSRLPAALFIVDISKEHIAVAEAKRLNIPTFAIVDTNSNPNLVDFAIPANDDASKSIELIVATIANAIVEGLEERKVSKDKDDNDEDGEESTEKNKFAAAEAGDATDAAAIDQLAAKFQVDRAVLASWFGYLGIGAGEAHIDSYITQKSERSENYDFVKGWVGPDALSVIANSSDQMVRVPGDMQPHSIGVHPTPKLRVAVGWRSPITGSVTVSGRVQRAHIGCGNGVTWLLELRRGHTRQRLAAGTADGAEEQKFGPLDNLVMHPGDLLSLSIGPRDGEHSCDLTAIDLSITADQKVAATNAGRASQPVQTAFDDTKACEEVTGAALETRPAESPPASEAQEWDLAKDISPDILAGNPHVDRLGNADVWHFYSEPDAGGGADSMIPVGSLIAQWQVAPDVDVKKQLADKVQALLKDGSGALAADAPDFVLHRQLTSLNGPLFSAVRGELLARKTAAAASTESAFGLDAALFGKHPDGEAIDSASVCVQAPSVLEFMVPADFVEGCEFVATGSLHGRTGAEGTVQMQVLTAKPEQIAGLAASSASAKSGKATWSDGDKPVSYETPILVADDSASKQRLLVQFDEFRNLFPAALCYTKIVPVDEVVTLTLYYREDNHLQRLMLNETQVAELDRLWDDMHFVRQDALALVDAYDQLWQFATQDADPTAFTPMRDGILQKAAEFRQRLIDAEPVHVQAVLDFAERAWRRPVTDADKDHLQVLYQTLRIQELPHDAAIRMLLARVLVAPAFLYRGENASPGTERTAISDWELATRLSYFLWSSAPDDELRALATDETLSDPEVLRVQTRRMLADARTRRMAIEFGCQWLHIRDFDQLDEKSEQHYPEFAGLKGDMYEESVRFFEDMFRNDGSVLDLLNADHTFVNARLAQFYGIKGIEGDAWRKVDGSKAAFRGGILTMAATLSKHSGASRTSPILRGNWVSEFLLGDKLPRPPKGVPILPEEAPPELTERQLIELHSSDPACAKCHQRIDGFGFALEQFDTIGRFRTQDAGGHAIDVAALLPDGTPVQGVEGLRTYLLTTRRDDFLRTFCRRLLGYALGRSVQLSDEPLIESMMKQLEEKDYRFSEAVETVVLSPQFRMIRGADSHNPQVAGN